MSFIVIPSVTLLYVSLLLDITYIGKSTKTFLSDGYAPADLMPVHR